jgi:hypothetical protein
MKGRIILVQLKQCAWFFMKIQVQSHMWRKSTKNQMVNAYLRQQSCALDSYGKVPVQLISQNCFFFCNILFHNNVSLVENNYRQTQASSFITYWSISKLFKLTHEKLLTFLPILGYKTTTTTTTRNNNSSSSSSSSSSKYISKTILETGRGGL